MWATSQGCQPEAEDKKQPSPATDSTGYRKQKPKAIKKTNPPQSLKAILPKDGRQLGVHVDPIRKNIIVSLPPCIAGTELGKTLAARMMAEDWHMHTVESVGSQLLTPTPPYDMIRHERTLGLRSPADTNCGHCKAPDARYKCEGCWTCYYCCQSCQRGDWKKHKRCCVPFTRMAMEYDAIAVPDLKCFMQYQAYVHTKTGHPTGPLAKHMKEQEGGVGLCVLSSEAFLERFGQGGVLRTCLHLAQHGRPAPLLIKVYAPPDVSPDVAVLTT
jgi:hypothetical protein